APRGLQIGRRIRHMSRLAQITNVFARHGLWSLAERMGLKTWLTPEQVREAKELSEAVEASEDVSALEDVEGDVATPVTSETPEISVRGLPARLRRSFEELGPAFVKLG